MDALTPAATFDNTPSRYGAVAVLLHWTMALILAGLAVVGLYMSRMPDVGFDKTKVWLVIYHKEFGMLAFALVVVRLAWSATGVQPELSSGTPEWQNVAARFVHLCFYGLMIALPVTGWIMSSAAAIPVSIFGLFYLPDLVPRDDGLFRLMVTVHSWLGYGLIACFAVHAGAALYHHFVLRDDTLRRMLP